MKPIKLTMQAFGSYGKKEVIDFTKPDQNLFLITGDTGAGKTTIFDAMVYALYGETSSSSNKVRTGIEMQSQFSDFDVVPFVELIFSEKTDGEDRIFSVKRIPKHFEIKKRGQGTVEKIGEVTLTLPDGNIFIGSNDETDKKIAELTGLSKNQFMQTGMIAQGEFMEVLRGETKDKKAIFSKLFKTDIYQKIVDELKKRKDEKNDTVKEASMEYRQAVAKISVPADYEDAQMLKDLIRSISSSDTINTAQADLLTEKMNLLCGHLKDSQTKVKTALDKAESELKASIEKNTQAETLKVSFDNLKKAEKEITECDEAQEKINEKEKLACSIEAAYETDSVYKIFKAADDDYKVNHEGYENNKKKQPVLEESYHQFTEKEQEENKACEIIKNEYIKVKKDVDDSKEIFRSVEESSAKLTAAKKEMKKLEDALGDSNDIFTKIKADIKLYNDELKKLDGAEVKYKTAISEEERYNGLEDSVKSVTSLQKQITKDENEHKTQLEKLILKSREYDTAKDEYERIRKIYIHSQAGLIARELEENKECPVCGSTVHPSPCILSDEAKNITMQDLDDLKNKVDELGKEQTELSSKCGAIKTALEKDNESLNEKTESFAKALCVYIKDISEDTAFEELLEKYKAHRMEIQNEVKIAKSNSEKFKDFSDKRDNAEKELPILEAAIEELKKEKDIKSSEIVTLETVIKENKSKLRYSDENSADDALDLALKNKNTAEKNYNTFCKNKEKALKELEQIKTLITDFEKNEPAMLEKRAAKYDKYVSVLNDKKLSEEEFLKIISAYKKSYTEELRAEIKAHTDKKQKAEAVKKTSEEAVSGKSEPDYAALRKEKDEAEERKNNIQSDHEAAKELHRKNREALDLIIPVLARSAEAVRSYSVVNGLYERLNGKVTGSRMDIETFVQRYYLDRILKSANIRLKNMSAGQYELRMLDEQSASKGANKGLDLKVYSAVTCKEREVGTLSGGESFMAALALSLGMSDQIQENSSAVNLDVMFIDEGFGSLDDHSRNQAIRVLQQMAGSSKMIGIISHVTELKHEIDNKLVITKDAEGSHAEWMIS